MVSKGDFALIHENQDSTFQYDQIKKRSGSTHNDTRWLWLKLVLFRCCYWHHKYHHVLCKLQCALKVAIGITRSIFLPIRCLPWDRLAWNKRKFQHAKKKNVNLGHYQIKCVSLGEMSHYIKTYTFVFEILFWLFLKLDIYLLINGRTWEPKNLR